MTVRLLFYVSGHGYGHVLRMAEVIRELLAASPSIEIVVRTRAPKALLPADNRLTVEEADFEARVHETADALRIDPGCTVLELQSLYEHWRAIVDEEVALARGRHVRLIVADVPFLAGQIAAKAGMPCVGISNFTWSWILRPALESFAAGPPLLQWMNEGYSRMSAYWRLPFSHTGELDMFPEVVPTPLLVAPVMDRAAARAAIGLTGDRPIALVGFRGRISPSTIARAAKSLPHWQLVTVDPSLNPPLPNVRYIDTMDPQTFARLLSASDMVVGKLGYGLAASCAAAKIRLLHAPRDGFREDAITAAEAVSYTCLRAIPLADFRAGRWAHHVERLARDVMPENCIDTSGAAVCASRLLDAVK